MKLIKEPNMTYDTVKVWQGVKLPSLLDAFRTDEEKIARRYAHATCTFVPGRMSISNIVVEDITHTLKIGEKIPMLALDGYLLQGVIPLDVKDDLYECCVDFYEKVNEDDSTQRRIHNI